MKFIMLINVKLPTVVGILLFIIMIIMGVQWLSGRVREGLLVQALPASLPCVLEQEH